MGFHLGYDRGREILARQGWGEGPDDVLIHELGGAPLGQIRLPNPLTGGGLGGATCLTAHSNKKGDGGA
jgi:hypothetical protein